MSQTLAFILFVTFSFYIGFILLSQYLKSSRKRNFQERIESATFSHIHIHKELKLDDSPKLLRVQPKYDKKKMLTLILFICTAIVGIIYYFTPPKQGTTLLFGYIALVGVGYFIHRFQEKSYKKEIIKSLPVAIDLITRSVAAGRSIVASISSAGTEIKGPVGEIFQEISERANLGIPLTTATQEMADRLQLTDFTFFSVVISIQQQTGGNIVELFMTLSESLRDKSTLQLKINALSAEGKASAYIMAAIPLSLIGAIVLLNPEYIMPLFTTTLGHYLLAIGIILLVAGVSLIFKLAKVEV